MLPTAFEKPLTGILQEIADVAGREAALAIQEVKGGQTVFIVSRLRDTNWLVRAVGRSKAQAISHHFTSGYARQKVEIPVGQTGAYQSEQRRRWEAMAAVIQRGGSANEIATAGRVTSRSARRFRGKYLASLPKKASRP
ncbi:hypothetical protein [Bosea sp. (in: a-proteobacteria)]